jgi:hypothetical protein
MTRVKLLKATGSREKATRCSLPASSTAHACHVVWCGVRTWLKSRHPVSGHASMPATPHTTNATRKRPTNHRAHRGAVSASGGVDGMATSHSLPVGRAGRKDPWSVYREIVINMRTKIATIRPVKARKASAPFVIIAISPM